LPTTYCPDASGPYAEFALGGDTYLGLFDRATMQEALDGPNDALAPLLDNSRSPFHVANPATVVYHVSLLARLMVAAGLLIRQHGLVDSFRSRPSRAHRDLRPRVPRVVP